MPCPAAEQDLPEDLSTLTALKTLRLDINHMVDFENQEEYSRLPLAAPDLQYLCLMENRQPAIIGSSVCWTHDLAYLTGELQPGVHACVSICTLRHRCSLDLQMRSYPLQDQLASGMVESLVAVELG